MFDIEGIVKRSDLKLRLEFPNLITKIYKLNSSHYIIICSNYSNDFETLKEYFNHSIRPMGFHIELKLEIPEIFEKEILQFDFFDSDPNLLEGIALTHPQLDTIIGSRFAKEVLSIKVNDQNRSELLVTVSKETDSLKQKEIKSFIQKMKTTFPLIKIIVEDEIASKELHCQSDPLLCVTNPNFSFSLRDSEYWFGNIGDVFSGNKTINDFSFLNFTGTKCYLDYSTFDNIDLRNTILLYDTTIISLPLADQMDNFFNKQNMTKSELINLIDIGKIKISLPNTEERYDKDILKYLSSENPNSAISKRGLNLLICCYYSDIEARFYRNRKKEILEICSELYKSDDHHLKQIANYLFWPIKGKLECFDLLNFCSPLASGNFSVNNVILPLITNNDDLDKISFEFLINAPNITIASALHCTYFPFNHTDNNKSYSDKNVAEIIGNLYSSYYYSSESDKIEFDFFKESIQERNYLKLIDCNASTSIIKFAENAEKYQTPEKLKNLLKILSSLNPEEQKEQIKNYNNLIYDINEIPSKSPFQEIKYTLTAAGFLPSPYGTIASIVNILLEYLEYKQSNTSKAHKNQIRNKIERIQNSIPSEEVIEDIYILDKLNRIARLKQ